MRLFNIDRCRASDGYLPIKGRSRLIVDQRLGRFARPDRGAAGKLLIIARYNGSSVFLCDREVNGVGGPQSIGRDWIDARS